jgi:transcriptional regulator with XRE-family HTH domain
MSKYFFDRLRAVRVSRLLSQAAMGELGGVTQRTQLSYELGERMPDVAYLQNLIGHCRQLGSPIDLLYLITGEISNDADLLSRDERFLIDAYRKAPSVGKEFIRHAAGMAPNITAMSPAADVTDVDLSAAKVKVKPPAKKVVKTKPVTALKKTAKKPSK